MGATEYEMNMHARSQYLNMYVFLKIIYIKFGFLEFYTENYWENGNLIKFSE
jgi:hypothetical protein